MLINGWEFHGINYHMPNDMSSSCGENTWYGFKYPGIGNITATFGGWGTATLDYGNCHMAGQTNVFVNDILLDTAKKDTPSKQVEFDFSPGDLILINEVDEGIIKLTSLTLKCRGE